jgi:hypothetical protein
MKNINDKILLSTLIDLYMQVESRLQQRIHEIANGLCHTCNGRCCREEICRESILSPFLSPIVGKQAADYDAQKGWASSQGCRLHCGRPLVCYDFFCDTVKTQSVFIASGIERIIKDFMHIGDRSLGNCHLVCVNDVKRISTAKLTRIHLKLESLQQALTHPLPISNP